MIEFLTILGLFLAVFWFRAHCFVIVSSSMEPTLQVGDCVFGIGKRYKIGDILVVKREGKNIVKRLAGISSRGELILRGDNIGNSFDSRHFGPVPAKTVRGKVYWLLWSIGPKVGNDGREFGFAIAQRDIKTLQKQDLSFRTGRCFRLISHEGI